MKKFKLDEPITFGKHRGRTPREIMDKDGINYIRWATDNKVFELDEEAYDYYLEGEEAVFRCFL